VEEAAMARRTRPEITNGLVVGTFVVALVGLLFLAFRLPYTWYHFLAAWLLAVNIVTFGAYGYDKGRARTSRSRIPEVVLHGLVLFGGTLGASIGMTTFRHKTIKPSFRLVFFVIVVLQVGLIAAATYRVWKDRG
jgi:uncharacterized membrane protein YsdA (DUF1294 family)